jgi:hypothetical protein
MSLLCPVQVGILLATELPSKRVLAFFMGTMLILLTIGMTFAMALVVEGAVLLAFCRVINPERRNRRNPSDPAKLG